MLTFVFLCFLLVIWGQNIAMLFLAATFCIISGLMPTIFAGATAVAVAAYMITNFSNTMLTFVFLCFLLVIWGQNIANLS